MGITAPVPAAECDKSAIIAARATAPRIHNQRGIKSPLAKGEPVWEDKV
jgi:hypothetical protein